MVMKHARCNRWFLSHTMPRSSTKDVKQSSWCSWWSECVLTKIVLKACFTEDIACMGDISVWPFRCAISRLQNFYNPSFFLFIKNAQDKAWSIFPHVHRSLDRLELEAFAQCQRTRRKTNLLFVVFYSGALCTRVFCLTLAILGLFLQPLNRICVLRRTCCTMLACEMDTSSWCSSMARDTVSTFERNDAERRRRRLPRRRTHSQCS